MRRLTYASRRLRQTDDGWTPMDDVTALQLLGLGLLAGTTLAGAVAFVVRLRGRLLGHEDICSVRYKALDERHGALEKKLDERHRETKGALQYITQKLDALSAGTE